MCRGSSRSMNARNSAWRNSGACLHEEVRADKQHVAVSIHSQSEEEGSHVDVDVHADKSISSSSVHKPMTFCMKQRTALRGRRC